ncbi:hypothetical protein [Streptomyces sp. NPDC050416]|uniref:MmyB family transcriptional regulator n=1 Tax=Streptomyces sp. NPDC050416 TaxID=3365611 RepID=UPI00379C5144
MSVRRPAQNVRRGDPADPAARARDRKTVRHPGSGDILLDCDVLVVPGADLRMVTYMAAAGSSGAGKLDLLRVTHVVKPA